MSVIIENSSIIIPAHDNKSDTTKISYVYLLMRIIIEEKLEALKPSLTLYNEEDSDHKQAMINALILAIHLRKITILLEMIKVIKDEEIIFIVLKHICYTNYKLAISAIVSIIGYRPGIMSALITYCCDTGKFDIARILFESKPLITSEERKLMNKWIEEKENEY